MGSNQLGSITRTLEGGLTFFSAAEIRVVRLNSYNHDIASLCKVLFLNSQIIFYLIRFELFYVQVVLPIGEIPEDLFHRYASLIMAHRKVSFLSLSIFFCLIYFFSC